METNIEGLLLWWTSLEVMILVNIQCSSVRYGRDRIVVEFTTTYAIGAYHH